MTPDRWRQIKELLGAALEMSPPLRTSYLNEACVDDLPLRQEVERLLLAERQAGTDFLKDSAITRELTHGAIQRVAHSYGRRIGPYQIVEEIGFGGMGEVFRARRTDNEYEKEVAIKLVRACSQDGFTIDRFRNERQILASLDHPNIARLLDGGTSEERLPYLVMELVEGKPIDEYCDVKRLSTTGRLKLFLEICSAVQYAHQRLIIHRDLKPANILVTTEGVPKLLDFGIAKILGFDGPTDAQQTATLFRLLTPRYASPEQVRGEVITTSSDVYSLGVVLYELLTGQSPYGMAKGNPQELAHAVCELEAEKPSLAVRALQGSGKGAEPAPKRSDTPAAVRDGSVEKLSKRLRGDLDNIVMMALRKEPRRRYVSVEQFAEDLRRHLADLPVLARKDTLGYSASKFVSRHKTGVAALAIMILTVTVGFAVTLREARIAQRRFTELRSLANSLLFDVHDSIKDLPGATPARRMLVGKALEYLDRLSQEAAGDASLQRELAAAYERVGDVQGNPYYANLGEAHGALLSYGKSLGIRQTLYAHAPNNVLLQRELAGGYNKMGAVLDGEKDFPAALLNFREAQRILESIGPAKTDGKAQDQLAGAYYYVGIAFVENGNLKEALANAQRAAAIRETIQTNDPAVALLIKTHLAGDYASIAQILMTAGDFASAAIKQRQTVDLLNSIAEQRLNDQTVQGFLGEAEFYFAAILESTGSLELAASHCGNAKSIFEKLLSADPRNVFAHRYLGLTYEVGGRLLVSQGKPKQGLESLSKALQIFEKLKAKDARNAATLTGFGESYMGMGLAYSSLARNAQNTQQRTQDMREARLWYQRSLNVWQELQSRSALDPLDRSKPEQMAKAIADCDARLARLATGGPVTSHSR